MCSSDLYTYIYLFADNHIGAGELWTSGDSVREISGNLLHDSWWKLYTAKNDFYVQGIAAGVGMEFYIGGNCVAQFVSANLGALVAAGFNGWIDWS